MGKFIDLTGQQYNDWLVLYKDANYSGSKIKWICKCVACNNTIKSVFGSDLRQNKSKNCGCIRKKKIAMRNTTNYKDITNKRYGYLIALEPTKKRQNTYVVWKCKCLNCGRENIEVCLHDLEKGNTFSCGCMNESHGEFLIKEILRLNNISFKTEVTFEMCRFPDTKALARFDFYVDNKYIIEYDGSQHFSPMAYNNCGWNNEDSFKKTIEHDKIKNKWCLKNCIPIIRIPYTVKNNITLEDLIPETSNYLIKGEDI